MVGKNNRYLTEEKYSNKQNHYGIRKLSVGVASVLLGTTLLFGTSAIAHADTVSNDITTDSSALLATSVDSAVALRQTNITSPATSQSASSAVTENSISNTQDVMQADSAVTYSPTTPVKSSVDVENAATHNSVAQNVQLNDTFIDEMPKVSDTNSSLAIADQIHPLFNQNPYQVDHLADAENVDINNLTPDQLTRINQYQVNLLNNVRHQLNLPSYNLNDQGIKWEQQQADSQGNKGLWGHNAEYLQGNGENVGSIEINQAGMKANLLTPKMFNFKQDPVSKSIQYMVPVVSVQTMDDLQAIVYYNTLAMLFYDDGAEANGHTKNYLMNNIVPKTQVALGLERINGIKNTSLLLRFIIFNGNFDFANAKPIAVDPQTSKYTINLIDDTANQAISSIVLQNPIGTVWNGTISLPHGYILSDGQTLPTSFDFNADHNITLHVQHLIATYHDSRAETNFNQTVHYQSNGQTIAPDTIITAKFQREYSVDEATGKVTIGHWSYVPSSLTQTGTEISNLQEPSSEYNKVNGFDSFNIWIPFSVAIDNYTQKYSGLTESWSLPNTDGFVGTSGIEYTVQYNLDPNLVKVSIIYKDKSGNVIETQTLNGKPNDKVTLKIPDDYVIDGDNEFTIPEDGIITVNVVKKETTTNTSSTMSELPTKQVIVFKDGDKIIGTKDINGKIGDKVTPNVPDDYVIDGDNNYIIPENGVITINVIKKETTTGTPSTTLKLPTKQLIIFKDDNKVVGTEDINGKTGDKVTLNIPDGYVIDGDNEFTIPKNGIITITVIKKKTVTDTSEMTPELPTKQEIIFKNDNQVVKTKDINGKSDGKLTLKVPDSYIIDGANDFTISENGRVTVNVTKKKTTAGTPLVQPELPSIIFTDGNKVVDAEDINSKVGVKVTPRVSDGYVIDGDNNLTIPNNEVMTVNVIKKESSIGISSNTLELPTKQAIFPESKQQLQASNKTIVLANKSVSAFRTLPQTGNQSYFSLIIMGLLNFASVLGLSFKRF